MLSIKHWCSVQLWLREQYIVYIRTYYVSMYTHCLCTTSNQCRQLYISSGIRAGWALGNPMEGRVWKRGQLPPALKLELLHSGFSKCMKKVCKVQDLVETFRVNGRFSIWAWWAIQFNGGESMKMRTTQSAGDFFLWGVFFWTTAFWW